MGPPMDDNWIAEVQVEIPFHDVDVMGVVWHGHYAKYFEYARTELFRQIGYDYAEMKASGYAWPVIEFQLRYAQPMQYGQRILVRASIAEYETRLRIDYTIRDGDSGRRLTRGHTIQVALDTTTWEMCFASPDILYDKLGVLAS